MAGAISLTGTQKSICVAFTQRENFSELCIRLVLKIANRWREKKLVWNKENGRRRERSNFVTGSLIQKSPAEKNENSMARVECAENQGRKHVPVTCSSRRYPTREPLLGDRAPSPHQKRPTQARSQTDYRVLRDLAPLELYTVRTCTEDV